METVLITGGTGLIGKALSAALLENGYRVIILTRDIENRVADNPNKLYALWDIKKKSIDPGAIHGADHIIHLAGAGMADQRWTKKRKQEIINSRVKSSELIGDQLKEISNKVKTVISSSAIGWYGPDKKIPAEKAFGESNPSHDDFAGITCRQWEESIAKVKESGKRLVIFRTGVVLSREGGALKEFLKPLHFGIAAILGNGRQVVSWIHISDLVRMYISAIGNEKMNGVYNAVAPHPVSNKELALELAKSRNKFYIPVHVPRFILRMIAGELSGELLKSCTVSSQKMEETGFIFQFPFIRPALDDLK